MRKLISLLAFVSQTAVISAQTAGDFQTINNGNWSTVAIWERYDGVSWQPAVIAPTNGNGVITIRSTDTVIVTANTSADQLVIEIDGVLNIANIAFTVANGTGNDLVCFGELQFNGGFMAGAGNSLIHGTMLWTDGSIGTGATLDHSLGIASGGVLTATTSASKIIRFNLIILPGGIMNWDGGDISLNDGLLNNQGIINNSFDGSFIIGAAGVNSITNSGTFNKTNGLAAGTILNNITWHNSGTINVSAGQTFSHPLGTMNFNAGSVISGAGTLLFAGGSHQFLGAVSSSAGSNITFSGGTMGGAGSLTVNGNFNWAAGANDANLNIASGGVLTINTTGTKTHTQSITTQVGGILNWDEGTVTSTFGSFVNNGIINFNADITLTDNAGSGITNNGTINKTAGSGGSTLINNFTWNNNNTINVAAGQTLSFAASALLNLNAGTTITGPGTLALISGTISTATAVSTAVGSHLLVSGGTLAGAGSLTINGNMTWTGGLVDKGLIVGNGGILTVTNPGNKNLDFSITINAGGTMNFDGGTLVLTFAAITNNGTFNNSFDGTMTDLAGSVINNNGIFNKSGGSGGATFINALTLNNTGTINIAAGQSLATSNTGVVNFNAGSTVNGPGTLVLNAGTHTVTGAASSVAGSLIILSGGTLLGAGTFNMNGNMTWTSGLVDGNLSISNGGILTANTVADKTMNGFLTIQNGGIMNWDAGNIRMTSSILTNNGTINNSFDGSLINIAFGTFNNNGTFNKTGGSGGSSFVDGFFNNGVPTWNNSGTINMAAGQTLATSNVTGINFNAGTTITGTGTLKLNPGPGLVSGVTTSTAGSNINFAGYTLEGAGSLTVNGNMLWTSGIIDAQINIANNAILTVNTVANKDLNAGLTIQTGGTMNWEAGPIRFTAGSLNNSGMINNSFDGLLDQLTGANNFNNNSGGTFRKTGGAGITTIEIITTNTGTIGGIGTINITGNLTNNGSISPGLSPGILTMNSTSPLFSANSSLNIELLNGSGAGTGHDQMQRAGNLVLNGTLNATETGFVPLGTYVIISLTSGTITGNFTVINIPGGYIVSQTPTTVSLVKTFFLPVELVNFKAQRINDQIELTWQTSSEQNSDYFAVERSNDGIRFTEMGRVQAAGNSTLLLQYRFTDMQPLKGKNFYRLRQVDNDANFKYSKIISILYSPGAFVIINTNPVNNMLNLTGSQPYSQLRVADMQGRIIKQFSYNASQQYDLSNIPAGVYIIQAFTPGGMVTIKMVKN